MVYPALLPMTRTPRPLEVDWTDAPADLNVLVRYAGRRNLVSVHVPSHINWPPLTQYLPGRPKDNHYKNSDQRVSVPTETFNLALLAYLEEEEEEEEEWLGGEGRSEVWHKCFSSCGYLRFYKMHIHIHNWTPRWNEHTDVKDYINRVRTALLFLYQPEAECTKMVACCIRLWCQCPMNAVDTGVLISP